MEKALIDIGGNVWVDIAAILYIEPNLDGSTVWVQTTSGPRPITGTVPPLAIIDRLKETNR